MSFAAAVDHLHALGLELAPTHAPVASDPALPGASNPAPAAPRRKFDLDHMRILARALGDPQNQFPAILIAGTNGKGSTAATLASILAAAGYRTGLYTSPHLSRVTERIRTTGNREQGTGNRRQQEVDFTSQLDHAAKSETSDHLEDRVRPEPCSLFPVPCSLFYEIPEDTFARLYFRVDDAARQLVSAGQLPHHPSFFESLTALAFLYFAEQELDIAILEVGLGGRLDATNIVHPILSVITDIALDHQDYLGNTIAEIAREKAGILRAGGILITLPQHPEANQAIGEVAIALNVRGINAADYLPTRSPTLRVPEVRPKVDTGENPSPLTSNHYDLTLNNEPLRIRSPLSGQHQQRNIALAIAAAIELRNHPPSSVILSAAKNPRISAKSTHADSRDRDSYKLPAWSLEPGTSDLEPLYNIPNSAIEAGIANTSWPGRLEFLPPNLILDVAHNPAGAWTLRAAIATLPELLPRTLIFSCLRDKDLTEMAQILFPLFDSSSDRPQDHIVLAPIDNPRAASLDELLAAARALDAPAHPAHDPTEALALARSLTPAGGLILATGSIYLIGAIRESLLPQ